MTIQPQEEPMNHDPYRRAGLTVAAIAGAIVSAGVLAFSAIAGTPANQTTHGTVTPGNHSRIVVHGCLAEDACRIDYRANRSGEGVWIIRRAAH